MSRAAAGCDLVFHVAAKAGFWGDEADYRRINVDGTRNVLHAAQRGGVGKVVHVSSPSVAMPFRVTTAPSGLVHW